MLVAIGTVLKPRGLQGEIKVGMTYNHTEIFNNLLNTLFSKFLLSCINLFTNFENSI